MEAGVTPSSNWLSVILSWRRAKGWGQMIRAPSRTLMATGEPSWRWREWAKCLGIRTARLFSHFLISIFVSVVRKVSGGLDPECEEVGEQLFAFLISLLHR